MSKPSPRLTAVNRPYWEGCNADKLMLQRCTAEDCGQYIFYPRVCCPHCGDGNPVWEQVSGRGQVLSYTLVQRPHHESFYAEAPFVFAAVTLEEGPMIYTRIEVDADKAEGLNGRPVAVLFRDDQSPGQKLPFFRLTD